MFSKINFFRNNVAPVDILLAEWLGDSALGQLADSSGNGNDLTLTGTVPNPASPTPPEGDKWLLYEPVGATANYLNMPTNAIDLNKGKMTFLFSVNDNPIMVNNVLFALRSADHQTLILCLYQGPGFDRLAFQALYNGVVVNNDVIAMASGSPTVYEFSMTWGADGLNAYIDGVLFSTSAASFIPSDFSNNKTLGGDSFTTATGFECGGIDAVRMYQRA